MSLKAFSLALATTALVALNLPAVAEDAKGPNLGATAADAAPAKPTRKPRAKKAAEPKE